MKLKKSILEQIIREETLKEYGLAYSEPGIATKVAKGIEAAPAAVKDVGSTAGHTILDIAGIIPLFGEVFDITNAIWYAREKEYLQAAFSAISIIPTVGDMIGKTGKLLLVGYSLGKSGIWKAAIPLVKVIQQNKSLIAKIFKKIAAHPKLASSYFAMEKALARFVENTYIEPKARDSLRRTQEVFADLKKTMGLKIAYKAGMTTPDAPMSVETPEDEETV